MVLVLLDPLQKSGSYLPTIGLSLVDVAYFAM